MEVALYMTAASLNLSELKLYKIEKEKVRMTTVRYTKNKEER